MANLIEVAPLKANDYIGWVELAKGYKEFYKTQVSDDELSIAWNRILQDTEVHGAGARLDGELVGIAHFLFHTTVWDPCSCYLQDLFTAPDVRGLGVARHLVEFVARQAKERDAERFYWTTQEGNTTARGLYDKIARYNGFIRYDFPVKE